MQSITLQKSKKFAVKIYNLCKRLNDTNKEFILSKQLLKSGTSIGANLSEAECAMSSNDFLAKVYISYKESSETLFWLELLKDISLINENEFNDIYYDCKELIRLLSSTVKTMKLKIEKK